jgi:hypothetical protein
MKARERPPVSRLSFRIGHLRPVAWRYYGLEVLILPVKDTTDQDVGCGPVLFERLDQGARS